MKFSIFLLSLFVFLNIQHSSFAVAPTSDLIEIEGRYAADDDGGATIAYPGVTFHLKFEGKGLLLKLDASEDELYLDVKIDDQDYYWIALEDGEQQIEIPASQSGLHSVQIVRRNETWQGGVTIHSIEVIDGSLIAAEALPEKKLMFIGDSITCGDSCDIRAEGPQTRGFEHNGRLSYGYQISRIMGTQCHLVSYGGRGVIRDWQGNRAVNNAPVFYERALADDEDSRWNHSSYIPDAFGICLGTNDFSRGIPDQNEFVNAYVEFVRKLKRDAPDAQIILIDSPMFGFEGNDGVKRAALSMYLDQVVEFVGCESVTHAKLGHYPGRPENAHPVASEHRAIAEELAPVFQKALE